MLISFGWMTMKNPIYVLEWESVFAGLGLKAKYFGWGLSNKITLD